MINNYDDIQKTGKEHMDRAMQSFGAASKGMQAIAGEIADYSKSSLDEGTAAFEKLSGVKSLDKVLEVQTDFVRSSYEHFFSRMGKIGEMYADVARDMYKPYEGVVAKAGR